MSEVCVNRCRIVTAPIVSENPGRNVDRGSSYERCVCSTSIMIAVAVIGFDSEARHDRVRSVRPASPIIGHTECTLVNHMALLSYQDLAGKLILLVESRHQLLDSSSAV